MLWGTLSPVLVYGAAAAVNHYPPRQAIAAVFVCVTGLSVLYPRVRADVPSDLLGALIELGLFGLGVVAVTRLAIMLDRLTFTREVLARRLVDVERERVGRDLHDLMGRTLVAASLRNQTLLRTLGDSNPLLREQLERIHQSLGRGQSQLRALTSGPAIAHLEDELQALRALCGRVEVDVHVEDRVWPPAQQEATVGLVVRETITHVLKYSRATWCRVLLDRDGSTTVVQVSHDGGTVHERGVAAHIDGRLASAVEAAGGESDSQDARGVCTVTVRLPMAGVTQG
ncbi:MAG: hypothetical protein CSA58_06715 [Micrococcales bacterium]|nr:MAG: hypothetical protein CSA58_06715 [Micrococcales bacterium]